MSADTFGKYVLKWITSVLKWITSVWLLMTVVIAFNAGKDAGPGAGLSAVGTALFSMTAAGVLKWGILWGNRPQKILFPVVAIAFFAFAYWLAGKFSFLVVADHPSNGYEWGIVSAFVGFICVTKRSGTEWPGQSSGD